MSQPQVHNLLLLRIRKVYRMMPNVLLVNVGHVRARCVCVNVAVQLDRRDSEIADPS